eukprot:GHUV01020612.1.p1 GENE.GHUV01020612.1~~GHUV01020612.1.p1  ORF type:complete len:741 (+),score=196.55 GHUV01020612.1:582-2804(+)
MGCRWCFQRPVAVSEEEYALTRKLHRSPAESRLPCAGDAATAASSAGAARPAPASSARAAVPQLTDGQQAVAQQIGSQQHQHQQQVPYALQQQLHQAQQLQAAQSVGRHIDSQFHIPFGELVFHRVIGHGSFKTVYRGRWRNTNVAIMRMREGGLLTEARLMQKLSTHPNLVQFYRWSHDTQGNEYIILELMPLGSLDKILLRFGSVLRTSMKLSMAEQIAAAMAELASEGVLHRDLAARNVLVQSLEPVHVKVADFGLAHQFANGDTANHTSSHTHGALLLSGIPVRWCSPEVLSHQAWSKASDVWAFGVTLWEVFADGTEPYAALTDQEVTQIVLVGGRLPKPPRCPREVYSLMIRCWAADPADRPCFDDILSIFSAWRLKHAQQAQLGQQLHHVGSRAPVGLPFSPRAHSLELHPVVDFTAAMPPETAAVASPFCAASSICSSSGSTAQDTQATSPRHLAGTLQKGVVLTPLAGVYRCLSEPLPGWDLNQHVKAVLQPAAGASSIHRSSVLAPLGAGLMPGMYAALPPGTPGSKRSISSAAGRGAAIAGSSGDCRCSPTSSADVAWPINHVLLQQTQQAPQLVCSSPLSRQASSDSCFSQVSALCSSSLITGSDDAGHLDSISEDEQSVELSFELEEMIDPNGQQYIEDLAGISGTWQPAFTPAHRLNTLGCSTPGSVRYYQNASVSTSSHPYHDCQTEPRQGARAVEGSVPKHSGYVAVRSLVYGIVHAAGGCYQI